MIVFSSLFLLLPALLPLAAFSSSSLWSLFCEMIPLGKEMVLFIFCGFVQSGTVQELDWAARTWMNECSQDRDGSPASSL